MKSDSDPIQLDYRNAHSQKPRRGFGGSGFAFWMIPLQFPWYCVFAFGSWFVFGDPEPTPKQWWTLLLIVSAPALASSVWELFFISRVAIKRLPMDGAATTFAILGLAGCILELVFIVLMLRHG